MSEIRKLSLLGANVAVVDADGKTTRLYVNEGQVFDGSSIVQTSPTGVESTWSLAEGELERLERIGALVGVGDQTGTEKAIADALEVGAENPPPAAVLDLDQLSAYEPAELVTLWEAKAPTVKAALAAVGDNAELAQKVLDAENAATKGDPRSSLKTGLEKVIAGSGE